MPSPHNPGLIDQLKRRGGADESSGGLAAARARRKAQEQQKAKEAALEVVLRNGLKVGDDPFDLDISGIVEVLNGAEPQAKEHLLNIEASPGFLSKLGGQARERQRLRDILEMMYEKG